MGYKIFLGYLAVIIGIISYIPYITNIFRGKTKPHAFSWLVWSILTGIAFAVQAVENGGAGAWVTGVTSLACMVIFILALFKENIKFSFFDWSSLVVAFTAIILWKITNNPVAAVILVTLAYAFGFFPTFRKAYLKPYEETVITFIFSSLKFLLSIIALTSFSIATGFYPVSLVLINGLFVIMVLIRRKTLNIEV